TDTLQVHRIMVLQRLELARQSQSSRIIILHMLIIFGQMLEGWHALTLGEPMPDRHGRFPETAASVQCRQIEQASGVELPLMRLKMRERGYLIALGAPIARNGYNVSAACARRDKCLGERWQ